MKKLQPKLMMNVPIVFATPFWYDNNNGIYPYLPTSIKKLKMRKTIITLLTLVLFQMTCHAQFFNNTLIKTRPYQDFIPFNPTLGFEKPINKILSIEVELMYRNKNWDYSGGEWDFGHYYNGDGYKILAGSRLYFGKTNRHLDSETQKAPFCWFGTVQLAYSQAKTYNIEKKATVSGGYINTVDVEKNWAEINIGLGRQFYLFKAISLELYIGPSIYLAHEENTTIVASENQNEIGTTETEKFGTGQIIKPNFVFTIGYYIK